MGLPPPSEQTLLITGISGFVGSWITHTFLEAGYKVRGTARSANSIESIKKAHAKYADRLSVAIVPDMAESLALNKAAEGVTGIIHTANPFILHPEDNERDLLIPSIQGVLNALEAAASQGSNLHRVVLTGSFANILDLSQGDRPGYVYTEADWNPATYEEAKNSTSGGFSYCAAKGLAEKAAWDWIESKKPTFSFVALNPPWVFGPSLSGIKSLSHLNESTEAIWKLVNGSAKEVPQVEFGGFVDVRDIALAHLRAYERDEAANQRFLVGSRFDYQSAVDFIRQEVPSIADRVPIGEPGTGPQQPRYRPDGSKTTKVLGIDYTPLNITLKDTVLDLLEAEKGQKA